MDIAIIFKPIIEFLVMFWNIKLTFAGVDFSIGSVVICLMVAGIVGIIIRG